MPFHRLSDTAILIWLRRLLTDLLEDDLAEVTYDASLAGLHYSVSSHRGGIVVSTNGYNDKLGVLLDTVLERLKTLVIKPDRLEIMREQVRSWAFMGFISS